MMEVYGQKHLLDLLKTVSDESRLHLVRLLHEQERSVGELAGLVGLGEPTVSHHLAKLREVGLVTLRMDGNQRFYRVNQVGLERFKRLVTEIEKMPAKEARSESDDSWIEALGWPKEELDVLREHTHNGRLTVIPSKQKKLLVILKWLATLFEADRTYSEQEVNAILKDRHREDHVSLRRDLVDFGHLERERSGNRYWLAKKASQ